MNFFLYINIFNIIDEIVVD